MNGKSVEPEHEKEKEKGKKKFFGK